MRFRGISEILAKYRDGTPKRVDGPPCGESWIRDCFRINVSFTGWHHRFKMILYLFSNQKERGGGACSLDKYFLNSIEMKHLRNEQRLVLSIWKDIQHKVK